MVLWLTRHMLLLLLLRLLQLGPQQLQFVSHLVKAVGHLRQVFGLTPV